LPMGAAPKVYGWWTRFPGYNPVNPRWFNRDRLVRSAGRGSRLFQERVNGRGMFHPDGGAA